MEAFKTKIVQVVDFIYDKCTEKKKLNGNENEYSLYVLQPFLFTTICRNMDELLRLFLVRQCSWFTPIGGVTGPI
jgi:hypothetical protein